MTFQNAGKAGSANVKLNELYCFEDTEAEDGYVSNNKGPVKLESCSPFKNQINYRRPMGLIKPFLSKNGAKFFPTEEHLSIVVDCSVEKLVLSRDDHGFECNGKEISAHGFPKADCSEGQARLDSPYGSEDPVALGYITARLSCCATSLLHIIVSVQTYIENPSHTIIPYHSDVHVSSSSSIRRFDRHAGYIILKKKRPKCRG